MHFVVIETHPAGLNHVSQRGLIMFHKKSPFNSHGLEKSSLFGGFIVQ